MTGYKGSFQKKDGTVRNMRFLLLKDLPPEFVAGKIKGGNTRHNLTEGMELVWDLDEQDLRIFNRNKVVDKIEEFEYNFNQ